LIPCNNSASGHTSDATDVERRIHAKVRECVDDSNERATDSPKRSPMSRIVLSRPSRPTRPTSTIRAFSRAQHGLVRCLFLCGLLASSTRALAGDWPQILGPHRDGKAVNEAPLAAWPAGGPPVAWTAEIGSGYAGPAVAAGKVILFHRVDRVERVQAWDAVSGKPLWQTDFPANYTGGVDSDKGPRCVPVIHGPHVFLFGAAGALHAVSLATGEAVWSRDLYQEFQAQEGYFGAGSTPLVVGNRLLVNVGGRRAGLVAVDLKTGAVVWSATEEGASYSSPTLVPGTDAPTAVFVTRMNAVGIDPQNGQERFRVPFGKRGPTVNAATPLVRDQLLFLSASYGVGAKLLKLGTNPPTVIWENDAVMSSQYTTCVWHEGHLYGTNGREDFRDGVLNCVEAATGKLIWSVPDFGVASVILIGQQLLALTSDGQLVLAPATPTGYRPIAKARVSQAITRALPAFSNQRIYYRENASNAGRLICLNLQGKP
jgi:outer membrane protein assembly factor BamB